MQNQDPALSKTIGEIVADDYRTAAVFDQYGIDFCCGGKVTLAAICREKKLEPAALLRAIEAVQRGPVDRSRNFAAWELPFLADYIVNTHHAYLWENDAAIAAHATKVAAVHGPNHPEVIEIARIFAVIAAAMEAHLRQEEEVFFPAVKRLDAARKSGMAPAAADRDVVQASLVQLGRDHEEIGDAVHTIRGLANGYTLPADACNTFMLTYRKLQEFEEDIHHHVHLENNILFPKAALL
jgi:regulator of cell morphogenesis and NO signaling